MTEHSTETIKIELPDSFLSTLIRASRSYRDNLIRELEELEKESSVSASPDFFYAKDEEINDATEDLHNISEIIKELDRVDV